MEENATTLGALFSIVDNINSVFDLWDHLSSLDELVGSGENEGLQSAILDALTGVDTELQNGFKSIVEQLKETDAIQEWSTFSSDLSQANTLIANYEQDFVNIDPQTQMVASVFGNVTLDDWTFNNCIQASSSFGAIFSDCVAGNPGEMVPGLFSAWVGLVQTTIQAGDNTIDGIGNDSVFLTLNSLLNQILAACFSIITMHDYSFKIRVLAGYPLSGRDPETKQIVTLTPMAGDPAIVNRLGTLSSAAPSVMSEFGGAITPVAGPASTIGLNPQGANLAPIAAQGPFIVFFVGNTSFRNQSQNAPTVVAGLRWSSVQKTVNSPIPFQVTLVFIEALVATVEENLQINLGAWIGPDLPESIEPMDTSIVGYGSSFDRIFTKFAADLVALPGPQAPNNHIPVITGVGVGQIGLSLFLALEQSQIDVSNPGTPSFTSDPPQWFDSSASQDICSFSPVPGAPQAGNQLDTSSVATTTPWPITNAGFSKSSSTIVQLNAETDWPLFSTPVMQPALQLQRLQPVS